VFVRRRHDTGAAEGATHRASGDIEASVRVRDEDHPYL
jgi:hypothetical protein